MTNFIRLKTLDNYPILINIYNISTIRQFDTYTQIRVIHSSSSQEDIRVPYKLDEVEAKIAEATELGMDDLL